MAGVKPYCIALCLIAVPMLAGCATQQQHSNRLALQGSFVTVEMRAHLSQDRWPDDGTIRIIAQNKLCAVEVTTSDLMFVVFPDGSRLMLKPSPDAPMTRPAAQFTSAGTIADIRGGRIDNGPATLRQAIIDKADCAPGARNLAGAWLAAGQLDFHGRMQGPGPLAELLPRTSTEFIAHARLTPAGAAILNEALAQPATTSTETLTAR